MKTVDISDATKHFYQLVDKAVAGNDLIVTRNGKPVVRITRVEARKRRIKFGRLKGKIDQGGL